MSPTFSCVREVANKLPIHFLHALHDFIDLDHVFCLKVFEQYGSGFFCLVHCRKIVVQAESDIFQEQHTGPVVSSHEFWNIPVAVVDS